MEQLYYLAAAVAVVATALAVSRANAVHALLYLVVSLLAVAVIFFLLGAPFAAALEIIIYAGAIMVLFVFVVMMLAIGPADEAAEQRWLSARIWIGPSVLALLLLGELGYLLLRAPRTTATGAEVIPAEAVGSTLFGPYLIAVELASLLLLAGLVGAFHLGARRRSGEEEEP